MTFCTVTYYAVIGLSERGAVPYGNELERNGIVNTNSGMCVLSTVDRQSSGDLLNAIGGNELI